MQVQPHHVPPLAEYIDLRTLCGLPEVQSFFPSVGSARWFIDQNRKKLIDAAAVVIVAGRLMIHPESFQRTVIEIGREVAMAKLAEGA